MIEHSVLHIRVFNELCYLAFQFAPALGKKYTVLSGKKDRGASFAEDERRKSLLAGCRSTASVVATLAQGAASLSPLRRTSASIRGWRL